MSSHEPQWPPSIPPSKHGSTWNYSFQHAWPRWDTAFQFPLCGKNFLSFPSVLKAKSRKYRPVWNPSRAATPAPVKFCSALAWLWALHCIPCVKSSPQREWGWIFSWILQSQGKLPQPWVEVLLVYRDVNNDGKRLKALTSAGAGFGSRWPLFCICLMRLFPFSFACAERCTKI